MDLASLASQATTEGNIRGDTYSGNEEQCRGHTALATVKLRQFANWHHMGTAWQQPARLSFLKLLHLLLGKPLLSSLAQLGLGLDTLCLLV